MAAGFNHDFFVDLFRQRPVLAPELLRRCAGRVVPGETAELASIDLSQVAPVEYRADVVILLRDASKDPTHAIVVEVQLARDDDKKFTWPVYLTVARASLRRPVSLLVIAPEPAVARWAAAPIYLGSGFSFAPTVLGMDDMPTDVDEETAHQLPELVLLAALAHPNQMLVETALREIRALPEEQRKLYLDELALSLPLELRRLIMDMRNYQYRSDFARQYVAQGREEGRNEGWVEALREVLSIRFGVLPSEIEERLATVRTEERKAILERALRAATLEQLLEQLPAASDEPGG